MSKIEKQPFTSYTLDEDKDGVKDKFTVRLNKEERELLDKSKNILEQPKDSTALKELAWVGAKVIHEEKMTYILGTVFKNKRNNKRLGIIDFD